MCCCKKDCCCVRWNKTTAIVGFVISIAELIFAAVYNFHTFGFCLALIGMILSSVFFYLIYKEEKNMGFDARTESTSLNDEHSTYRPIAGVEELYQKNNPGFCRKLIWVLYVTSIVCLGLLAFARLFALCRRTSWRSDLDGAFPTACGSWAEANGCTRVTLS